MAQSEIDTKQTSLYMWTQASDAALEESLLAGEISLDASERRNTERFREDKDYSIIKNVYLNKNINPYITNYKTWQSLGDTAAASPDNEPVQRMAFKNYDFDFIVDQIDSNYKQGIDTARRQSTNETLDPDARAWWEKRKIYLDKKWSGDKREAHMYQAQSWLGQTDDIIADTLKFVGEGAANLVANGIDLGFGYSFRMANHLSFNLLENAVNKFLFPSNYAEQTRVDKLPELEKKIEFNIPGTDIAMPSLRGFDGSFNDYLGKNWAQIHESTSNWIRKKGEMTYSSRIMANGRFRQGAETVRDFLLLGKGFKAVKRATGRHFVNNPTALQKMDDILAEGYRHVVRESGKIKGTAKYLAARNARHNVDFIDKGLQGRELRRSFDIATSVLAWTYGAEAYLFDSKFSSIKIPTNKWDWPLFEFDTHAGIIAAPVVAGAGGFAYRMTAGKAPQWYAQFQMGRIAAGWSLFTRKNLWGFAGPKMNMGEAVNKYLIATRRILPEDLAKINERISTFDMENAIIGGKKLNKDQILDAARGTTWTIEDYLYTEWMSGRLTDARRVEATYKNPADRTAIGSFLDKMEILGLDRSTAKAQHDMYLLFDEMAEKGSPLARNTLEYMKTAIETQDRLFKHFFTEEGMVQKRYRDIIEPSDINQLYMFFDQYTNLKMASNYRRMITDGGDLGTLGNRVDGVMYNDLAKMLQDEGSSLIASTNMLNAIVTKLGDNLLPESDPLNIFLKGAQTGIQNQIENYTNQQAEMNTVLSQLKGIQQATTLGVDNINIIASKLDDAGFDKPKSVQTYDNTFKQVTNFKKNEKGDIIRFGSDYDGFKSLGTHLRATVNTNYDEIFGEEGIVNEAYNVARTVKSREEVGADPVQWSEVSEGVRGKFYESADKKHVIFGNEESGFQIGDYGGDTGFVQGESFPTVFPTLEGAKLEVQSFENNLARAETTEAIITYEPASLRETLNRLAIPSGENIKDIETGEITFRGATTEGWATQKDIVEALKLAGIWGKYNVGDTHSIPSNATVDDLIAARSIINKMRWKEGLVTGAKDIDVHAEAITDVLNQIPGFERANEIYQAYAKNWKNDFGVKLTEKQEGGNYVLPDFNIIEEFIKFGIEQPQGIADVAYIYFGPRYKSLIEQGFAHGINAKRFTTSELDKAGLFLEEVYDKKLQITGLGDVATDRLGRKIETLKGGGRNIKTLIDSSKTLGIELNLDIDARKTKATQMYENTKAAEIQLDKVMFALTKGEEKVIPFIKDFAEKGSVKAMHETVNTLIRYNPEMNIEQIKAGLLTGFQHTLMSDLVYGSNVSMLPSEIVGGKPTLIETPTEGVFKEEGLTPQNIGEMAGSEVKVTEVRGWQSPYSEGSFRNPFEKGGVFNTKGFITYGDENIIKQLRNKELEWTDVLKGWNGALDKSLREYDTLIEFLTTGEGAVPFLKQDIAALGDLSKTQRNLLEENLQLGKDNVRAPVNVPRKWTAQQQAGFLNTYMKRITSRFYAISYASFQAIRMRHARLQVRMFTDPNLRNTMDMVFSGKASKLDPEMRNAARSMLIASLPTINELYPEEGNETTLAKYEHIREAAILDLLAEYGLAKKKQRIGQMSDIELIAAGKSSYPGDVELTEQIEKLDLQSFLK